MTSTKRFISNPNKDYRLDLDGEDEYTVEHDDLLSHENDDYLSIDESSTLNSTNESTKKQKTANFFTETAQQAARHLLKLFTSNKKQKTITTITRTTTTTTTLKANIQHTDDELSLNDNKLKKYKKTHQIAHRIPFHQKSKNFKMIQFKMDRFSLNNVNHQTTTSILGFTIVGYCPCQIGKVDQGSIAAQTGLLQGDLIIKINNKNVSRATCDSIVKIIKNLNDQHLVLDIYRVNMKKSEQKQTKNRLKSTKNQSTIQKHKLIQQKSDRSVNKTAAFLKEQQYHHRQFITMNNKLIQSIKQQDLVLSNNNNKIDQEEDEIILAEAEAAAVVVAAAATVTSSTSAIHSMPSPIPYLPPIKHLNDSLSSNESDYKPKHLNRKRSSITDSDYKTQSSTTATDNDADSPNQQHQLQDEKYIDLDGHMNECEQIFRLEEEFISLMQSGVQQYSRPLRHLMMISQLEHHLLFQNIEKILVLSEYQLNQLISHDESTLIEMFNTIGKLYENKMRMSCEAFDIYLNGIENSFNLLISLIKNNSNNKKFNKFLYESKTEMDLKTFLLLPLYYVSSIYNTLIRIRSKITQTNCDFIALSNLIASLESHVNKSNLILNKYDNQMNKNPLCPTITEDLVHSGTLKYKHKLINLNLYKNRFHLISSDLNHSIELNQIVKFNFNLANKLEFQFSFLDQSNELIHLRFRTLTLSDKQEWIRFLSDY